MSIHVNLGSFKFSNEMDANERGENVWFMLREGERGKWFHFAKRKAKMDVHGCRIRSCIWWNTQWTKWICNQITNWSYACFLFLSPFQQKGNWIHFHICNNCLNSDGGGFFPSEFSKLRGETASVSHFNKWTAQWKELIDSAGRTKQGESENKQMNSSCRWHWMALWKGSEKKKEKTHFALKMALVTGTRLLSHFHVDLYFAFSRFVLSLLMSTKNACS